MPTHSFECLTLCKMYLYRYLILLVSMSAVYSITLQSLATYKLTGYINIIKIAKTVCFQIPSMSSAFKKSSFVRVLAPTNMPMSLNPRGAGHLCGLSLVYYWSLLLGFLWLLQLWLYSSYNPVFYEYFFLQIQILLGYFIGADYKKMTQLLP